MKVAICISGVYRGYFCKDFIDAVSRDNDVKIFIYYWEHDPVNLPTHSFLNKQSHLFEPEKLNMPNMEYKIDNFERMMPIFSGEKSKLPTDMPMAHGLGFYSMCYVIMKSNEMREEYENKNNMKFDCVMRTRFETHIFNNKVLDLKKYDMNILWTPKFNVDLTYGMNDCHAFSN